MNCDNIKMMISDYLDNELPKEKEGFLFTHLSTCSDCREEFKQLQLIQHEVKVNQKEVGEKFEKRMFGSLSGRKMSFSQRWITKPTPVYVNYALGLVIIVITLFSFLQLSSLKYDLNIFQLRYEASLQQMNYQASQMYLMMNSMPAVEIKQY
jgi:predicted anti-sigma-YlaC factor YlaD